MRILFLALFLTSCSLLETAGLSSAPCPERVHQRIYLGMNTPDGIVSESQWQLFLRDIATPLFPAGFTVYESSGQWRGNDHQIVREASRVIEILHEPGSVEDEQVHQLARTYKERFKQDAVMIVQDRAGVCFE